MRMKLGINVGLRHLRIDTLLKFNFAIGWRNVYFVSHIGSLGNCLHDFNPAVIVTYIVGTFGTC